MSLTFRILGEAGGDNAVLVQIDSGQSVERLLFDCGDGCLSELAFVDILGIDHLFFSHLHMDHVGGFDSFFRCNFSRSTKPNRIWGPPETTRILQHRFQGFLWNLHEEMSGAWVISDIHDDRIYSTRFELREAFAVAHDEGAQPRSGNLLEGAGYTVEAVTMDHRTPTLAYIIRERARRNIDMSRMQSLGLRPGPWLKQFKESSLHSEFLIIHGVKRSMEELRELLIVETPGESLAYLTDFRLDESSMERLSVALQGCDKIICEAQYRHSDLDLAKKNFHMTTVLSASLARQAGVKELVLFHLSDRYQPADLIEMLQEARQVFPNTHYPAQWNLGTDAEPCVLPN